MMSWFTNEGMLPSRLAMQEIITSKYSRRVSVVIVALGLVALAAA